MNLKSPALCNWSHGESMLSDAGVATCYGESQGDERERERALVCYACVHQQCASWNQIAGYSGHVSTCLSRMSDILPRMTLQRCTRPGSWSVSEWPDTDRNDGRDCIDCIPQCQVYQQLQHQQPCHRHETPLPERLRGTDGCEVQLVTWQWIPLLQANFDSTPVFIGEYHSTYVDTKKDWVGNELLGNPALVKTHHKERPSIYTEKAWKSWIQNVRTK